MSSVMLFLCGDAALLALAVFGASVARKSYAPALVYFCALAISTAMLIGAVVQLLGGMTGEGIVLPLGLPWIGAISASTRSRRSFLSSSILAAPRLASTALAMDDRSHRPSACCRSSGLPAA